MRKTKQITFLLATMTTWACVGWTIWNPVSSIQKFGKARQTAEEQWAKCGLDYSLLRPGDLIVRAGRTFFSNELRKYNQHDKTFSHCGLISRNAGGRLEVIHSIGGTDNPESHLKMDPLFFFCHPDEITQFAIYRYDLDKMTIHRMDSLAHDLLDKRVPFDLKFDLSNDSTLYCAEFIYKVISEATNDRNFISLTRIQDKLYVGVDDLFLNKHCTKIYEHAYH